MREINPSKFPELMNIRNGDLPEKVVLLQAREWSVDPTKDPEKHILDPMLPYTDLDLNEFEVLEKLSLEGYEKAATTMVPWTFKMGRDKITFYYTNRETHPKDPKTIQLIYQGGWDLKKIEYEKWLLGKWKKSSSEKNSDNYNSQLSLDRYDELWKIAQEHYQVGSRMYYVGHPSYEPRGDRMVEIPVVDRFEERFFDSGNERAITFFYEREG